MNVEFHKIFNHAIMISGFVFVMMLVIEYINVHTKGLWIRIVSENKWKQYLLAALLGATPGCLGAFTAVSLFTHRMISFGALVTAMIATSGDDIYVMFAIFPQRAVLLTFVIFIVGIIAGYLTDKFYTPSKELAKLANHEFPLHLEDNCKCFPENLFIKQLRHMTLIRVVLLLIVSALLTCLYTGWIAEEAKLWIKMTLAVIITFSLFIVITVPEHFLKEHLWDHVLKKHLLKIFCWTMGSLYAIALLTNVFDIESFISSNMSLVLVIAVVVGMIPESGPHLIFVTLFAQGNIPFSILLANSISQDGHGMLPLLAESRRSFITVKLINMIFALIVGATGYLLGF